MSMEAVKEYFSNYHMDHRIMVLNTSTATVDEAVKAHGVDPDQIGKTLSLYGKLANKKGLRPIATQAWQMQILCSGVRFWDIQTACRDGLSLTSDLSD